MGWKLSTEDNQSVRQVRSFREASFQLLILGAVLKWVACNKRHSAMHICHQCLFKLLAFLHIDMILITLQLSNALFVVISDLCCCWACKWCQNRPTWLFLFTPHRPVCCLKLCNRLISLLCFPSFCTVIVEACFSTSRLNKSETLPGSRC